MSIVPSLTSLVHSIVPHNHGAIYLASAVSALGAISLVYLRCRLTKSRRFLEDRWVVRTATFAAPMPIYAMMLLAPLDPDLVQAMMEDYVIVALAGLYGLSEAINDIRATAGRAREKAGAQSPNSN